MSLSSDATMTMPVAPVGYTGNNGNCGGFGGFGGEGAWFIIILFLFAFLGWGNNGRGGFGSGNGGGNCGGTPYVINAGSQGYDTRADIQRSFDNSAVITKLDGITNGICDSTYSLTNAINSGFSSAELSRCNQQAALMQQLNNMAMQAQNCCCENRAAIAQVRYDMATQACDTRNTIQNATRDIIDNSNANSRAILDFLTQDKINTLQAENQNLKFQASQTAQNAFITANQEAQTAELIRRLGRDCPVPAYVVPNPNCCYGNPVGVNYGCNNGCGC